MYILFDKNYIIKAVSTKPIKVENLSILEVENNIDWDKMLYKKIPESITDSMACVPTKENKDLRIAFICNWKDKCGISTYSEFVVNAMKPKVKEIFIFSEKTEDANTEEDDNTVKRCWTRGGDIFELIDEVKKYNPDFIIIQHEYGIFPNAFKFMQLMQSFENIPYVVVMHSVYKHLDKAVYSECSKNIIVHSEEGKETLKKIGNTNNVFVVPHGCMQIEDTSELWNICVNPYTVMQFGFGFSYKGVDRAINAIAYLKSTNEKYKDIQYLYLCSTNNHNYIANAEYCKKLMTLSEELNVKKNVVIIQKYQTERMINLYLRLAKISIFPYVIDPSNEVFGASGAIRMSLSNKRPTIASESHLFDDLEGIVPRPKNYIDLAKEIDLIFSSNEYRNSLVQRSSDFVSKNSWDYAADKYLEICKEIIRNGN